MLTMKRCGLMVMPAFLFLTLSAGLQADPADKKSKEEKQVEKEKVADEKNANSYEKVKEFSLNKYKTDPEFRDEVDAAYEQTMREHSEEAYRTNINRRSQLRTVSEDTWRMHEYLYDNLLVQDHINRIGQKLVPADSEKLYAFRVVPDPTPFARTLSTGTVYVSTGLISMLDSEAQLAFVLAHEMAHVHLDHWKEMEMMKLGVEEYNKSQEKKAVRIGMLGAIAGGALGGALGRNAADAALGVVGGGIAGLVAGSLLNKTISHTEWDHTQEDQADDLAFKAVLGTSYDVREVPKLYQALDRAAARDTRIQLGFIGQRKRLKQRQEKAEDLINNAMKAEIELKAKNGFVSSSAEHRNLMAELKRDNGIMAYYHDMFDMARTNLQDAVAIRDNDPAVHYFYAKTLKLVGRTDADMRQAKESFFKATQLDKREQNYGSHLQLALMLARESGVDPKQVEAELDTYVTDAARWSAERGAMAAYPPNLDSIYEYISLYGGDPNWQPKTPDLRQFDRYRSIADIAAKAGAEANVQPAVATPTAPVAAAPPPAKPPANPIRKAVDAVPGGKLLPVPPGK
jgi:predicted Zn-dependent protease